jgi:hypothetical protein
VDDVSRDSLWLRIGVASVWLATGVMVVHPLYRAIGASYLGRLGMPAWLMPVTCAFEIGLAFLVALGRPSQLITLLQISMVATFTAILALAEPKLLVSPFGMLTKNVPIVAAVAVAHLIEREGWSGRAQWLLRGGMAAVWITEGVFPKILFQQAEELTIATQTGLSFGRPATMLLIIGVLQAASGVAALLLRGRPLRWLLAAQAAGLIVLPLVVSWFVPWLWFHPFGPFTKNVPVLLGTLVVLRRCSSWS